MYQYAFMYTCISTAALSISRPSFGEPRDLAEEGKEEKLTILTVSMTTVERKEIRKELF